MNRPSDPPGARAPRGLTLIGIFLIFATLMALLAGTTLLVPGTPFDNAWSLNPRAYADLSPFGKAAGTGFLLLAGALALAAFGWFQRRLWGWRLTVALIAAQVAGNLVNLFRGRVLEGAFGIAIASALLCYLLRERVRVVFATAKP